MIYEARWLGFSMVQMSFLSPDELSEKAMTPTSSATSTFLLLPPDSSRKGHCYFHAGSLIPVPYLRC